MFGVAALLGLFAMHGLAPHGTAHDGHAGDSIALVTAAGHDHAGHSMTMDVTAETSTVYRAPGAPEPDRGLLGLAGMCLAVLLVGVIVIVVLGRGFPPARELDAALLAVGWPARARRDRDPPCLFALSIQRC